MNSILKAMKDGWDHSGIEWRKEFIEKGVDPDKFLELPNGAEMVAQYMQLQGGNKKTIFLNTVCRSYPFLRRES